MKIFKKYRRRSTLQGKLRQMVQTEGITRFLYYAIGQCGKMSKLRATNFNVEQRYFNRAINNVLVHFLAMICHLSKRYVVRASTFFALCAVVHFK